MCFCPAYLVRLHKYGCGGKIASLQLKVKQMCDSEAGSIAVPVVIQ